MSVKMKNKRIIIIGTIVAIVIVVIISIVISNNKKIDNNYGNNEKEGIINNKIEDIINNNSNLPVKYMSKFDSEDVNLQQYEKLNNYMSKDFKDSDISFSYYGYPNDESEYCLGKIELLTNKYNILGVSLGDNMKQSISKIEKYGFKLEESDDYFVATLNYKDFTITIEADTEDYEEAEEDVVIGTIELKAKSEYLGNKVY